MTLQECKNEIAKKYSHVNWYQMRYKAEVFELEKYYHEAAELYAQSKQIEILETAKNLFLSGQVDYFTDAIDQTLKSINK